MGDQAQAAPTEVTDLLATTLPRRSPLLVVLSGPSGVGKDAVLARLVALHPHLTRVVTFTTRPRRPGEVPGIDYEFVSETTFLAMRDRGDFLETTQILGHHYGTPAAPLRRALANGRDVVLKIDTHGALEVRRSLPDAVLVFLAPPSPRRLVEHLRRRRWASRAEVDERLQRARSELAEIDKYDYVVVNPEGHPEQAAEILRSIVVAEKQRVAPRRYDL